MYTMRPDGSRIVEVTFQIAAWTSDPDFNPAGNRIGFVKGFPGDARSTVWQMRPDGQNLRRLAPMRTGGGGYAAPSFAPSGRSIVVELTGDPKFSKVQVIRPSRPHSRSQVRRAEDGPDARRRLARLAAAIAHPRSAVGLT